MNGKPSDTSTGVFADASNHGYSFASTDWKDVWGASSLIAAHTLNSIPDEKTAEPFFGLTGYDVKAVYREAKQVSEREDRLWSVRENLKKMSIEELSAIMHVEAVRGRLWTGAHLIAERNQQNENHGVETFDRASRQKKIVENFSTMRELGYAAEEVKSLYSHKKIWETFTPHPTKDKNAEGEALYRQQSHYADEVLPQHREHAMAHLVSDMMETTITPQTKDSYEIETVDGLTAQGFYNRGLVNYFEDVQGAADSIYGIGAIDFLADDMHMDVAARKWHGGDADGKKIPATVLFNQRVQDSLAAVQTYINTLATAYRSGDAGHNALFEPIEAFKKIEQNLQAIAARGAEIREAGSSSPEFAAVQEEFVRAFTGITYKGQRFENGPKLTGAVIEDLRTLTQNPDTASDVRSAAWRTTFLHKQNGMAMGRTELRHNAQDYNVIFDNLYTYIRENHPDVIKEKVAKLSDLSDAGQRVLLKRLMERYGEKMNEWLLAANPPSDDSEQGWSHEILERFRMVRKCYNHNRMGTAIIAEADAVSAVKQQFLAEAFGIKNMLHVALNEDQDTIKRAAENLAEYTRVFGLRNLEVRRVNGNGHSNGETPELFYCIMDPQSDSQKAYGLFIKGRQRHTKENLIDLALSIKQPVFDKIGTGASYARGGFSPKIVPRLFINILEGRDGWEQEDKKILRQMASFVSTTIQGRDAGMRFGTTAQAYDLISGIDDEMNAACMVIDEKIPATLVAPAPVTYTPAMEAALERIRQAQCDRYNDILRGETSKMEGKLAETRLDLYMDDVAAIKISESSNVGARPDARKKGKKNITEARAIGCNIAITNSETHFDGSYTLGYFLRELHDEYKAGRITQGDLKTFVRDEFYMNQIFPNAFAALASADYEHGFDQLTGGHSHKWNVQTAQDMMKSNYARMNENLGFHTVLANDAIHATAYMEALLRIDEGAFDLDHDQIVASVYDGCDKLRQLKFGERTRAMYPDIDQLQSYALEKRLSRAVIHEVEERMRLYAANPDDPQGLNPNDPALKPLLHHLATAHRNKGPINMNNLLDQPGTAFGRQEQPVMDRVRHHVFGDHLPANDVAPDSKIA